MSYTPGPWHHDVNCVYSEHSLGVAILEPDQKFWGQAADAIGDRDVVAANARLIAAAPELLEASERVMRRSKSLKEKMSAWSALHAAITKAKGELV